MSKELPEVYLARHGETAWTISHQHTGRSDIPLTPRGELNARSLGDRLRGIEFERVLTSPLSRPIMDAAFKSANEIYAELSGKNPNWKKVYEDWVKFRNEQILWLRFAEAGFDDFMRAQKF